MAARFLATIGALSLIAFPAQVRETKMEPVVVDHGVASYYGDQFQGRTTASGAAHDQTSLTAASKDLPLGTKVRVTNLENGKSVDVEINDRGPYVHGRVIDLSKRAAANIGIGRRKGVARVKVEAHPADQPSPELEKQVAEIAAARRATAKRPAARPK